MKTLFSFPSPWFTALLVLFTSYGSLAFCAESPTQNKKPIVISPIGTQEPAIEVGQVQCLARGDNLVIEVFDQKQHEVLHLNLVDFIDFIAALQKTKALVLKPEMIRSQWFELRYDSPRNVAWKFNSSRQSSCQFEISKVTFESEDLEVSSLKHIEVSLECQGLVMEDYDSDLARAIKISKENPITCEVSH